MTTEAYRPRLIDAPSEGLKRCGKTWTSLQRAGIHDQDGYLDSKNAA